MIFRVDHKYSIFYFSADLSCIFEALMWDLISYTVPLTGDGLVFPQPILNCIGFLLGPNMLHIPFNWSWTIIPQTFPVFVEEFSWDLKCYTVPLTDCDGSLFPQPFLYL